MKNNHLTLVTGLLMLCAADMSEAAIPVQLSHQSEAAVKALLADNQQGLTAPSGESMKELSQHTDFNQTTHIRLKQQYNGYPVWGGDAVVHVRNNQHKGLSAAHKKSISANGVIYKDIGKDLSTSDVAPYSRVSEQKALQLAINEYAKQQPVAYSRSNEQVVRLVYVSADHKAHWAYKVSFLAKQTKGMPAAPVYIIDANNHKIYKHWNNVKYKRSLVAGGGIGGNDNIGKLIYDGAEGHLKSLQFERDGKLKKCYLRNSTVIIKDVSKGKRIPSFTCSKPDPKHNNVYWNTLEDSANGGYSPNTDGVYSDMISRQMYKDWFGLDMLTKKGKPMQVTFNVHDPSLEQNAYYYNGMMNFGEGDNESYPVVAPSVVAHEMTHGFTEQHSNLIYDGQSGGLNESFSDMADKAVEYFQYGKNNWGIDAELLKPGGRMLRWMDEPTKDCEGNEPGNYCSISHVKDYFAGLEVHFSSGVFNKAFYLIATKWNTKKAFEVMTQANVNYWVPSSTFIQAACGVIKATNDYKYDTKTVHDAFAAVGIDTRSSC